MHHGGISGRQSAELMLLKQPQTTLWADFWPGASLGLVRSHISIFERILLEKLLYNFVLIRILVAA